MILEVEGCPVEIKFEEMTHLEIARIFEPDLEEFVLTSEGEAADADDIWLSKLLASYAEEKSFPLAVDIFFPSYLCDPDTILWALFPHECLMMPKEEETNVTRHLLNLFNEFVVALKLFKARNFVKWF